jgi:hypothetical protein
MPNKQFTNKFDKGKMTTPESGFARHVAQIFHSCAPIGL